MKGTKEDKWARSPHVMALTERFNQLAAWVTSVVVFEPEVDGRRQRLTFLVQVARCLREMNNFNGMMAGACTCASRGARSKLWHREGVVP